MSEILTANIATSLARIIEAAIRKSKVARVDEDGNVAVGIARSIGDDRGYFLKNTEDIRDAYLRVTLLSGFEAFWPIRELVPEEQTGLFVTNYHG